VIAGLTVLASGAAAVAQNEPAASVVAIPPMTTPTKGDAANTDLALAWQATQLIATDLRSTSEIVPLKPDQKDYYSYPEVNAPSFPRWRSTGAKSLMTGFVQTRDDGRLTIGCYVYELTTGRELARKGFVVGAVDWRRAAHKCSGTVYQALTGAPGMFDTKVAYVAETGGSASPVRRIAIMDSDGYNHDYLTKGDTIVLSPRVSPGARTIAFVGYSGGNPTVRLLDIASGTVTSLLPGDPIAFAPRFSPDGRKIAFTMMQGGNADIYLADSSGGPALRLTTSPGIDTAPSFSPDGTRIVFESDRSGTQQLYVMGVDGRDQRRLSFGGGAYAAPAWSPDGESIAFTARSGAGRRIGIMRADGTNEHLLSTGPFDDSAAWAASSKELLFERSDSSRRPTLMRQSLDGSAPRSFTIPQPGSDPDWSGVLE
jgi:TolB protein